jgi:hypothetical protein
LILGDPGVVSHTVGAVQLVPSIHCTQRWSSVHADMPLGQPETFSVVHRTQVFVVVSHAGPSGWPAQSVSATHSTQLVPPRHAGVSLGQRLQMPPSGTTYASGMTASGAHASSTLNASAFVSVRLLVSWALASTGPASIPPFASEQTGLGKSSQETVSRMQADVDKPQRARARIESFE